jgi:hypothetical protein
MNHHEPASHLSRFFHTARMAASTRTNGVYGQEQSPVRLQRFLRPRHSSTDGRHWRRQRFNNKCCISMARQLPTKLPHRTDVWCHLTPMFSERTGFDRVLDDISKRHRAYLQNNETGLKRFPNKDQQPLALLHPAFIIEPKMDGERMLVHVSQDGVIRMHTRRGNWYRCVLHPLPSLCFG